MGHIMQAPQLPRRATRQDISPSPCPGLPPPTPRLYAAIAEPQPAAVKPDASAPPPPPPPPLHTEEYLLLEIVCQGRHTSADKLGLPLQVQLQVLLGLAASSIDAWVS